MTISWTTRTCPHCADPMFLVNLYREDHDLLHSYKCSSFKQTSRFVKLSDAFNLWLPPKE
jgi:hypothetical protein